MSAITRRVNHSTYLQRIDVAFNPPKSVYCYEFVCMLSSFHPHFVRFMCLDTTSIKGYRRKKPEAPVGLKAPRDSSSSCNKTAGVRGRPAVWNSNIPLQGAPHQVSLSRRCVFVFLILVFCLSWLRLAACAATAELECRPVDRRLIEGIMRQGRPGPSRATLSFSYAVQLTPW